MPALNTLIDAETTAKLLQTGFIATLALALFYGLKGRIARFAQWARLPRLALTPVRLAIRGAILVGAGLLILGRWGFEVNGIIAVIGTILGLVAIGFVALWSVLSNFLCTLVLVILKPFCLGDEVEFPTLNVRGRVIDLSVVFTTLEQVPGEVVMVPNNTFFQMLFKRRRGAAACERESPLAVGSRAMRAGAIAPAEAVR
jgi:small-conductance mechanosensitive channel